MTKPRPEQRLTDTRFTESANSDSISKFCRPQKLLVIISVKVKCHLLLHVITITA